MKEHAIGLLRKYGAPTRQGIAEYRRWLRAQSDLSKSELTYDQFDETGVPFRSDNMSATDRRTHEKFFIPLTHPTTGMACPVPKFGWRYTPQSLESLLRQGLLLFGDDHSSMPRKKSYIEATFDSQMSTIYKSGARGKALLDSMNLEFPFAHSLEFYSHILDACISMNGFVLDFFGGSGTTAHAVIALNREDSGNRRFILVESGAQLDEVMIPRVLKACYSPEWSDGVPIHRRQHKSAIVKSVRLESYEDALNNLELTQAGPAQLALESQQSAQDSRFKEDYMLKYMLDVETKGSQSLLNISAFKDPTAYKMKIKRPGTDESRLVNVDLLETFNWLLGLTVDHIAAPKTFTASFERDDEGRLVLSGQLKPAKDAPWWFRTVEGKDPDGRRVLVLWRKRPGGDEPEGLEQDNLVLNEWFRKIGYSTKDKEFDLIYVNGSNNLENTKTPEETWKVRLIEEDFMRLMFDVEDV